MAVSRLRFIQKGFLIGQPHQPIKSLNENQYKLYQIISCIWSNQKIIKVQLQSILLIIDSFHLNLQDLDIISTPFYGTILCFSLFILIFVVTHGNTCIIFNLLFQSYFQYASSWRSRWRKRTLVKTLSRIENICNRWASKCIYSHAEPFDEIFTLRIRNKNTSYTLPHNRYHNFAPKIQTKTFLTCYLRSWMFHYRLRIGPICRFRWWHSFPCWCRSFFRRICFGIHNSPWYHIRSRRRSRFNVSWTRIFSFKS